MPDISHTMIAKSDQLNNVDLIGRELLINITGVDVKPKGQEQPIAIRYQGDEGKPYKPCKSMIRVIAAAWGNESAQWVGRSMKLVRDAEVTFGKVKAGGIRISHMSDIADTLEVTIPIAKGRFAPYSVQPLIGHLTDLEIEQAKAIARMGTAKLTQWWSSLGAASQKHFVTIKDELKRIADDAQAGE